MTDTNDTQTKIGAPVDIRDEIQGARALIPVGPSGATPMNFAQQVDYSKTMCQAKASLPKHLAGSAGDCLAIIDIASRANLSPYMVANKTYLGPDGRLAFESQLFHAFLIQSNLIVGDFDVSYAGDGDEMTCTVSAKLRSDGKVRTHTSPPLAAVRPRKNEEGKVKGSPLWQKKPLVQLFYDTSRDWIRIYAPTATLGIFAPEEFEETPIGPDSARDISPGAAAGLTERIAGGGDKPEGFRDGNAAAELDKIAAAGTTIIDATTTEPAQDGQGSSENAAKPSDATVDKPEPEKRTTADPGPKAATKKGSTKPTPHPKSATDCQSPEEYVAYAKGWIDMFDRDKGGAQGRFDDEFPTRQRIGVGVADRSNLQRYLDDHFAKKAKKGK